MLPDEKSDIEVTHEFERFRQRNDIFTRAFWDKKIKSKNTESFFSSYRMEAQSRQANGFTQRDVALRNASWLISDVISNRHMSDGNREGFMAPISYDTPVAANKLSVENSTTMSSEIKHIAKFFGADLCGITELDKRWLYESRVDTRDFSETKNELPKGLTSVIVLGHEMDLNLVNTYPSALAGAATGREYSHEAGIVMQLAAYIRNLGYEAIPSMNDTGLVIPYAIKAGLGEYARNQMVITPEFGPRLRFSKIFTNIPLAHDSPNIGGVRAFCDICTKCADACPVGALPYGEPKAGGENISAIKGVRKWTSNAEKCFSFWAKITSDCAICMRVCPFNRNYSNWFNKVWLKIALSPFRKLALWLDRKRGNRKDPKKWWKLGET